MSVLCCKQLCVSNRLTSAPKHVGSNHRSVLFFFCFVDACINNTYCQVEGYLGLSPPKHA